jgi:hypothetical protein
VLEHHVESYFDRRVTETGGERRKLTYRGRKDAPDSLVWWPKTGRHAMVELKRPGETPRTSQVREHERLKAGGFQVWTIDNHKAVDIFIDHMTH